MINRNNWNLLAGLTNVLCKFLRKNCTQSCCLRKICTQSCCLRKNCTQSCCLRKNCTQSCCLSKNELYINVYNLENQLWLSTKVTWEYILQDIIQELSSELNTLNFRLRFQGYRCESGIAIFESRVTWNYILTVSLNIFFAMFSSP